MTFLGCTISDGKTAGQKGHALFQKAPPLADAQNTCVGMAGRCTQGGPSRMACPLSRKSHENCKTAATGHRRRRFHSPEVAANSKPVGGQLRGQRQQCRPCRVLPPKKQRHQQSSGVSSYPFEQRWAKEKQMESSLALTQQLQLFGLELASVRSKDLVGLD